MVKMGTVWDRTAEFLSDNIGAVVPIALLAFFVPASISGSLEGGMLTGGRGFVIAVSLLQLAFAVLSLWGSLAIAALAVGSGARDGAGRVALQRLGPALLVSVAMLAGVFAILSPIPIAVAASGVDVVALAGGGEVKLAVGTSIFILVYGLAATVLLLWLWARLAVVTPVIVREELGFAALARSWRLTRGTALRIICVTLLLALVSWVSIIAGKMVFGVIFELVAGGGRGGISLASVLTSIVAAAIQTAFTVLVPAFTAKLYLALTTEERAREGVILA